MYQPTIFNAPAPETAKKQSKKQSKKQNKQKKQKKAVITVTFGDSGENHVGNQQIGRMVKEGEGFNYQDFIEAKSNAEKLGLRAEIIDLRILLSDKDKEVAKQQNKTIPPAYIIIIKDGIRRRS